MALGSHCSLVLPFFCIFVCYAAVAHGVRKQLPYALVVGTVYCDTCFHRELSKPTHFISVECGDGANKFSYRTVATTNQRGVFRVPLPPRISKHLHLIQACSVKLMKSEEPFCAVASSATTAGLRLKSWSHGVHVYSAGFFKFKPLDQPELCHRKPALRDRKIDQPALSFPLPTINLPSSPPGAGGVPLPTNPLFQPPSLLPPNPLQTPPTVLPQFPLQPPSPSFSYPPLPFLTPPPPPALPFPATPFLPLPRFPGLPLAFSSKKASP
ncbi:unnamed protein product [Musa acuminata subsp. malaccensis]|uniref:(wild Malaysian banana) hypothetical protein n=1 Tax=Musa acuminata subsp. malaccensis TaxID=214687 RepID=A0A804ID30_MUSAM|nr:PREDICTED: splicing factor 3A subunit 2-like [Musa acuminata subsp. malaccensis]CAG1850463.1 unnamed protein product [Musa acuminata subsp. malaccensis]